MRLWSIHPSYLDCRGLVALWREGLLAQKVLSGKTRGYRNHPQLTRFINCRNPTGAISTYLRHVADEADCRGYHFNRNRIIFEPFKGKIPVNNGQIDYEFRHLLKKLMNRDPLLYSQLHLTGRIKVHPLFRKVRGDIEHWEVI